MDHNHFEFELLGILLKNKIDPATPAKDWKFRGGGYCFPDEVQLVRVNLEEDHQTYYLPPNQEFLLRRKYTPDEMKEQLDKMMDQLKRLFKKDKNE